MIGYRSSVGPALSRPPSLLVKLARSALRLARIGVGFPESTRFGSTYLAGRKQIGVGKALFAKRSNACDNPRPTRAECAATSVRLELCALR